MMSFEPIAIVGRACVLPGALSPAELWQALVAGRDLLTSVPAGRWRLGPEHALCAPDAPSGDRTWSDRGGYVEGFESVWNPEGFALPAADLADLDPLAHWVLHTGRQALSAARTTAATRTGAVFGNLGFPTERMAAFAEQVWTGRGRVDPRNRFMSGGTAALLARALRLDAGSFCLDAACASSLYAIKLACDRLHDHRADVMLAGAVQRADNLFLHIGFSALNALSRSGRSRPFHRDADGLVPAEGAAFVALKRLADAHRDGDTIHGVVRGIGLSNDGRGKGLLAPSEEGQARAIRAAYAAAGIDPKRVSLLECHATGTPVGDATELVSSASVFAGATDLPIGSMKSNLGHLITAAGAAGLIKLLEAMHAGMCPPTLHVDRPNPALQRTPFRLLTQAEPWNVEGPRIAAISAFGFGGNNAHLIVSEDDPGLTVARSPASGLPPAAACPPQDCARPQRETAVAIVGLGICVASAASRAQFTDALFSGSGLCDATGEGRMGPIELDLEGLRFPPHDLAHALPQQLAMLRAGREALAETGPLPRERTAVLVGMEPDPEVARHGCRWRLAEYGFDRDWTARARAALVPVLESAAVLGSMPNIPANRLSSQFDLAGPAFALQAGEASGVIAVQLAARALACGEIDAALVGAVDFGCEAVQRAASARAPGDAAVALVLKRLDDAERDGDRVYALVEAARAEADPDVVSLVGDDELATRFGHAQAAFGLLRVTVAALGLHYRSRLDGAPWLAAQPRRARIAIDAVDPLRLAEAAAHPRRAERASARLHVFAGGDQAAVVAALKSNRAGLDGPARLVLVADDAQLDAVRARALAHLEQGAPAGRGIHFRECPLAGEVAFAFAGAGASYRGMGRELLLQLPQLLGALAQRSERLATALDWSFEPDARVPSVFEQLCGSSALSQLHLELSQNLLGLRADAWLGYSSGETNALIAAGVWNDPDALMGDMEASGLLSRELSGSFDVLARQWGAPARWTCWTVLAPLDEVRRALAGLPRLHIAIVNGAEDCLIAGEASQCDAAIARLGPQRCLRLDYPLVVHAPELDGVAPAWLELHRRATSAPRHGRVYSSASGRSYAPSTEGCAQAILDQARATLDIRPLVENAWNDGVRVFVEHGPGGTFARAIRNILGDRDALVVSLDRKGQGIEGLLGAVAALVAAGVPLRHQALEAALAPSRQLPPARQVRVFDPHPMPVRMPPPPASTAPVTDVGIEPEPAAMDVQTMRPAPRLPPVLAGGTAVAVEPIDAARATHAPAPVSAHAPRPSEIARASTTGRRRIADPRELLAGFRTELARVSQAQQAYADAQARAHERFLEQRRSAFELLLRAAPRRSPLAGDPEPRPQAGSSGRPPASTAVAEAPLARTGTPRGPCFDRRQLQVHAEGRISEIFGPQFAAQDEYVRQVRMPRPPLLLADRVTGLDAAPNSMGKGTITTETDVVADAWYLHQGCMPAGVMVEAGQADLMLISYLGVDRYNRGERVYRLLGCELTYHGDLPRVGDTLRFEIHLDGHAAQGDIRLMFFHYDCDNGGRPQLSVRHGQAGFFTDAELAESAGCLWSPQTQEIVAAPRLDAPRVECTRASFNRSQLEAFAAGDTFACFGPGFEPARTHTRSPGIHDDRMLLLDRITTCESRGGPWGRGYTRAELDIRPEQWFFDGHFKNDPCMPGTLMLEGCLQALAFHLAACGYTLDRDGWRFQPVPATPYQLQCRGQVIPSSRLLVTEVFVEEIIDGPTPTVYADLLCTVDGLKAFHARRLALQLVPDWPLSDSGGDPAAHIDESRPVAVVDGFGFDRRSLLACALGRPSEAFGPMYTRFDGPTRVARLPAPPYHFVSRIAQVEGPIGVMKAGARVVAEYDLPSDVWYLDEHQARTLPFAVLLEAALQPCGWLSSYVGSALTSPDELSFRNLDGSGTLLAELHGGDGILRTEVELTAVSASAGMIIESFAVQCFLGDRAVYRLQTVFGFFPPAALAAQAGLPTVDAQRELLARESNVRIDLRGDDPFSAHLGVPMLRMIDRIEGVWPDAGAAGLGQLRAAKAIDSTQWFFKAHFFQDPVQPGSLGVQAMIQTLEFYMLHQGMDAGIEQPRFEALALDRAHQWKYRGQVLPHHRLVQTTLEITEAGRDGRGAYAVATASLWVDGQRIYEAKGLGVRIVSGA